MIDLNFRNYDNDDLILRLHLRAIREEKTQELVEKNRFEIAEKTGTGGDYWDSYRVHRSFGPLPWYLRDYPAHRLLFSSSRISRPHGPGTNEPIIVGLGESAGQSCRRIRVGRYRQIRFRP